MGNCCGTTSVTLEPAKKSSTLSLKGTILFENFSKKSDYKKKYQFIRLLGNGGFGKVRLYKERQNPDMKYAIKTIKKDFLNQHGIKSIMREVEIIRKLDHPNIVNYFETYEDDKYLHIVMEYIPGENLLELLSRTSYMEFGEIDICKISLVLFKTVQFLHNNHIIHRDLKPENILFSISGNYDSLKLIDFGLSIDTTDKDDYRVGSPYYMAPEMIKGKYSFGTDIWSIGVILYFMISGKHPFLGRNRKEVFRRIEAGKYNSAPLTKAHCSDELKDLIKKMLVMDPKKRLSVSDCLEHPWFDYINQKSGNPIDKEILTSIKEFSSKNILQKEILFMMARISKESEITKLKEAFAAIDTDHSGEIEFQELLVIFEKFGILLTEIQDIWASLDFHKDGKVNYSEFLAATLSSINFYKEEKLWSVFKYFDVNETGFITADSVIDALKACNLNVNKMELTNLFQTNGSQKHDLTFEEFKELFFGVKNYNKKKDNRNLLKGGGGSKCTSGLGTSATNLSGDDKVKNTVGVDEEEEESDNTEEKNNA